MKNFIQITQFTLIITLLIGCTMVQPQTAQIAEVEITSNQVKPVKEVVLEERDAQVQVEKDLPREKEVIKKNVVSTSVESLEKKVVPKERKKKIKKDHQATVSKYGRIPNNYRVRIKSYLKAKNIVSGDVLVKYIFSRPVKGIKKDKSWKGWFVDVDILKQTSKRKIIKTKLYTVLFKNDKIVEVIEAGTKKGEVKKAE